MDLSRYRTIIFDLDGTLYDKRGIPLRLIFGDLRNMLTLKAERVARKEMKGLPYPSPDALYTDLFSRVAASRKMDMKAVAHWYREQYMPLTINILRKHYSTRPGVRELFSSLREKGISVVVLSDYGFVEEKLQALGIDPSWADLVVGRATLRRKGDVSQVSSLTSNQPLRVHYYNLAGQPVQRADRGFFIEKTIMQDGTALSRVVRK